MDIKLCGDSLSIISNGHETDFEAWRAVNILRKVLGLTAPIEQSRTDLKWFECIQSDEQFVSIIAFYRRDEE